MSDEKLTTMTERLFTSPSSLTPSQRANARYGLKKTIRSKIDYIKFIMGIGDEDMKKFIMTEIARLGVSPKNVVVDDMDDESGSVADAFWEGRAEI